MGSTPKWYKNELCAPWHNGKYATLNAYQRPLPISEAVPDHWDTGTILSPQCDSAYSDRESAHIFLMFLEHQIDAMRRN
eukprot:1231818-Karenia_brevis.AAC.1